MPYKVHQVDLSAEFEERVLAEAGTNLSGVAVTVMPTGATCKLRIGDNGYFRLPGVCFFDASTPQGQADDATARQGVYVSNTVAQPGVVLEVVVFTHAGRIVG